MDLIQKEDNPGDSCAIRLLAFLFKIIPIFCCPVNSKKYIENKYMQGATSQSIDGELCILCPRLYCLGSLHKCNTRLLGNVCESVPLDRTGSYVSISMENTMYINNYNTCSFVLQVDASFIVKYL